MSELPTRWERAMAPRLSRFLGISGHSIALIAFAIEGSTYGIVGTLVPHLQKRRVLTITRDRAYLTDLSVSSKPRRLIWQGERGDIRVLERLGRKSRALIGEREIVLPSPANKRVDQVLGQ